MKTLVIGGVAGGASAAARLRRLDETAEIIMLERGPYISFANCGLPYYICGEITNRAALTVMTPEKFKARFNVDVRVESEVVSIDRAAKTVTVRDLSDGREYRESYDRLILSPGAAPIVPPLPGASDGRVFTLRNIPDTLKIKAYMEEHSPSAAVVIGGGYIGVEMAENLKKAGLDVTIVEMTDHVIAPLDYDMACEVHRYLRAQGVRLILRNGVKAIRAADERLRLELNEGSVAADMVIMAVGVKPDTSLAKSAGLLLNSRGAILVDPHMRTSDENIYAVGDAVAVTDLVTNAEAYVPLAGPANKEGRIAADNICGIGSAYRGTQGSAVLKILDMTVAMTGVNERAARAACLDYDKVFLRLPSHATYYPGATEMTLKVIFAKLTGRILGAQIVGLAGVDKRCDVLAVAVRAGMTAGDLTNLELCYAPPYGSAKDLVNFVGYAIENLLSGKVRQYHWYEVANLPKDGSVTLLDVRTRPEYEQGHIKGTVHIPLEELRSRVGELDASKPVYINCKTGLRSYVACRMLSQKGFACYNLSGGYWLYQTIRSDQLQEVI